jgi:hypothetical protein
VALSWNILRDKGPHVYPMALKLEKEDSPELLPVTVADSEEWDDVKVVRYSLEDIASFARKTLKLDGYVSGAFRFLGSKLEITLVKSLKDNYPVPCREGEATDE